MSLFDGKLTSAKRKPNGKTRTLKKVKQAPQESLIDKRYGTGTRSYNKSTAAKRTRDERRDITERYERGELKFENDPHALEFCRCGEYEYPHQWHTGEMDEFKYKLPAKGKY